MLQNIKPLWPIIAQNRFLKAVRLFAISMLYALIMCVQYIFGKTIRTTPTTCSEFWIIYYNMSQAKIVMVSHRCLFLFHFYCKKHKDTNIITINDNFSVM